MQEHPLIATQYVQGTGTTSVLIPIRPGEEPNTLVVLDHAIATTATGVTAGGPILYVAGTPVARQQMAANTSDFINLDFGGGYPVWSASGSDERPYRNPNMYDVHGATATYPIYGGTAGSGELNQGAGMSFTVGAAGYTMYGIQFLMDRVGEPADTITVTMRSTSITGSVVATSQAVGLGWGGNRQRFVDFTFITPFVTVASTKYFFQILRSGARSTTNYTRIPATTSSGLAAAGAYTLDSTTWSGESATDDLLFRAVAGVDLFYSLPANSTGSTVTAMYHYANPAQARG